MNANKLQNRFRMKYNNAAATFRRYPEPTDEPMRTGDIIEYLTKGSNCPLNTVPYYVKKELETDGDYYFYASLDKAFNHVNSVRRKYERQIGFAQCAKGRINLVQIADLDPVDAQNCGIATALSFLCMYIPGIKLF